MVVRPIYLLMGKVRPMGLETFALNVEWGLSACCLPFQRCLLLPDHLWQRVKAC
jgi:hypothetical protein